MNMKKIVALICAVALMITGMGYIPSEVKAEKTTNEKSKATIEVDDVEDLQSDHPYANYTDQTWVYKKNNAAELSVVFNESCALEKNNDFVYVYDKSDNLIGTYTGNQLANAVVNVPGNIVKIKLLSDDSENNYGFKVDDVFSMDQIEVTQTPIVTRYLVGQKPSTEGLKVKGKFNNGTTKDITSKVSLGSVDINTVGEKTVNVTYSGLSTSYTLDYVSPQFASLEVKKNPNKTEYSYGEKLDLTGLELKVTDVEEYEYTVKSGYTFSGYNSKTIGFQNVKISYKGLTTTVEIRVKSPVKYTVNDGEVTVTGIQDSTVTYLEIPSKIDGYPVCYIGNSAFAGNEVLQTVTLPNTLKEIGDKAFRLCTSLNNITIPNGVTRIGITAFSQCKSFTEIIVPKSVEYIGPQAFSGTIKLEKITVPFIGVRKTSTNDNALFGRIFADDYYGDGVTTITQSYETTAGNYNSVHNWIPLSLREVVITDEDEIPSGAFSGFSMLTSIKLNDDINKIGKYAFNGVSSSLIVRASKNTTSYNYMVQQGITVYSTKYVEFEEDSKTINLNSSKKISPIVTMYNGLEDDNPSIQWTSLNTSICTVNSSGVITAVGKGSTRVKVKVDDVEGYILINVRVPLTSISINEQDISLDIGKQKTLTVSYFPSDTTDTKTITWESDEESVARVNSNGTITAVERGVCHITARGANGTSASCEVTVLKPATNITLNHSQYTLYKTSTLDLDYTLTPSDSTDTVSWTSGNTSIAKVSSTGVVTPSRVGTVAIAAKTSRGLSANCIITIKSHVSSISISGDDSVYAGDSKEYSLTVSPSDYTDKITWSSSNKNILTVDQSGNVTGVSKGTAKVIATSENGVESEKTINVLEYASNISLNSNSETLEKSKKYQLSATVIPIGADEIVSWKSSNTSIAIVSSTGLVTAIRPGTATIYAETAKCRAQCKITVVSHVESITINGRDSMYVGDWYDYTLTVDPSDYTDKLTWTSSNKNILIVDQSGRVTGMSKGTADIIVTSENGIVKRKTISILKYASSMTLSDTNITLNKSQTKKLTATLTPSDHDETVSWTSTNISIATVSTAGNVVAKGVGTAYIVARTHNCEQRCKVEVKSPATSVEVTPNSADIFIGQSFNLLSSVSPNDCTDTFVWSSSRENIATVDENGRVIGKSSGTAIVTYTSSSNKSASCVVTVSNNLASASLNLSEYNYTYDGTAHKPGITLKYNGKVISDAYYSVEYINNKNVGIGTVKVTGKNGATGEKTALFNINKLSLDNVNFKTPDSKQYTYTGEPIEMPISASTSFEQLVKDKDYTIKYSNTINTGTATVQVTGKGNYTGTRTFNYTINARDINECQTVGLNSDYYYTGNPIDPDFTLQYKDKVLLKNIDFTTEYFYNVDLGVATMYIHPLNSNYTGVMVRTFNIVQIPASIVNVSLNQTSFTYTSYDIVPTLTVTYNGETLTEWIDYTVAYSNNVNVGTASVKVTLYGKYQGEIVKTFKINKASIPNLKVYLEDVKFNYTGKQVRPEVFVESNDSFYEESDFYVTYSNNTKCGTAKAYIHGKNNLTGTVTRTFKICPVAKKKTIKLRAGQRKKIKIKGAGKKKFKSLKKKVAKVNKKGVVTGLRKGTAKIRVTVNGVSIIVKVKVKKAKVIRRRATVTRTTNPTPTPTRTTPSAPKRQKAKKFVPKH